jgi:hypothetical protein
VCEALEKRELLAGSVVINELLASNATNLTDEDGAFSDWLELHNATPNPINLDGWHLTDSAANLAQWTFPNVTLGPNAYMVIFASSKNRTNPAGNLHTNFNLSAGGEYLGLTRPDSSIEYEYAPSFPAQTADISYGLGPDGITRFSFPTPTPGAANSIPAVLEPLFSIAHGYYSDPFSLAISSSTPGASIRYTTDGSVPTDITGTLYSLPITISTTTAVRAIAFKSGQPNSPVQTQTYLFPSAIFSQPTNPAGFPAVWGGPGSSEIPQPADYEMDPDVINNPAYTAELESALTSIPSVSLVMPVSEWFSTSTGIITNRSQETVLWERAVSAEMINPGGPDFQIDAGVRVQGGNSTTKVKDNLWSTPKLSFSLRFKSIYGASHLVSPLFPDTSIQSFDELILDARYNYTWPHFRVNQQNRADYIRDQLTSDLQNATGSLAPHGYFVHVYLNGLYWGVYNLHERPDEAFAASYFGGEKEDYDVIKHDLEPDNIVSGDSIAYEELLRRASADLSATANYQAVADYLDIPDFINYMLVNFYAGNTDWAQHNWYVARKREEGAKFHYFSWDAEHVFISETSDVTEKIDLVGPTFLHHQLRANAEYRQLFADHVQQHFSNRGALTYESVIAQFTDRVNQIRSPIILESARWGDNRRPTDAFERDVEWQAEIDRLTNSYFPQRTATVLEQLRSDGLVSNLATPTYNQRGGRIPADFNVILSAAAGTIYYTLDGSDPRLPGGNVSPSAIIYTAPFSVPDSRTVRVRAKSGAAWSPIDDASFVLDAFGLRVTEIMYNPPAPPAGSTFNKELFEFLEIENITQQPIDLEGVQFTTGITFNFPKYLLQPGERTVIVANQTAFAERYGTSIAPLGLYTGSLSNSGEQLRYQDALGDAIQDFTFVDTWHPTSDGGGFSLVIKLPSAPLASWSTAAAWQPSNATLGSPGNVDPDPDATAALAGKVFLDANADGIQNDGGTGVTGTVVRLHSAGNDGQIGGGDDSLLKGTTTIAAGDFSFSNLRAGSYYLEFLPPAQFGISPKDQGGDDTLDSDVDTSTRLTAVFALIKDLVDSTHDAGLIATPEIAVRGNGVEIASGDTTPTTADFTEFGSTTSNVPVTRTFTITNSGSAALNLTGTPRIQISGANTADFVVAQPAGSSIPAGQSATFQITFTPQGNNLRTATIVIHSSDSDEGNYRFAIQGTGGFERIIDDGDAGFTKKGTWTRVTNSGFQNDFELSTKTTPKAVWTFGNLPPGQYQTFVTWVPGSLRSQAVPYLLFDGTKREGKLLVNQRIAPSGIEFQGKIWAQLPIIDIGSGTLKVTLTGKVAADAMRIVKVGAISGFVESLDGAGPDVTARSRSKAIAGRTAERLRIAPPILDAAIVQGAIEDEKQFSARVDLMLDDFAAVLDSNAIT